MTDYKKVFLDTAPVIYFLDDDVNFGQKVADIFSSIIDDEKNMVTSVITCEEYLVFPYQTDNTDKIDAFFEFVADCGIPIKEITKDISIRAAKIRARYKGFKGMDALQLAAACELGCDVFLTNDKQLKQFTDIRCVLVDEWL